MRRRENDRRVIQSKMQLGNALLAIMRDRRWDEITITELVETAGLSRATFYKHYNSIGTLFEEMVEATLSDLVISHRRFFQNPDQQLGLSGGAIGIFQHVYRYADFYRVIFNSDLPCAYQNRIITELKNLANEELLHLPPNPNIDSELRATYRAYSWLGLVRAWMLGGFKYSPHYLAGQLAEIRRHSQQNLDTRRDG